MLRKVLPKLMHFLSKCGEVIEVGVENFSEDIVAKKSTVHCTSSIVIVGYV